MIEEPERDFFSLVAETRDCLHALNRLGGPETTYYKLAQLLKEQTPRFDWNEEDTRRFILAGQCRFHDLISELRGKKQNHRDLLTLDDVVNIRAVASARLQPLLETARKAGTIPELPTDLVVANFGQEINFVFFTAAAGDLARDTTFHTHILSELERVTAAYVAAKAAKGLPRQEP